MTFSIIAPVHFGWFVWSLASPLTAGKQQCVGPLCSESSIRHEGRTFSPTARSRKYSGQSCALFTDTTLCDLWIIKYVQTCTWTVLMWTTCSMLSEETREWGHLQCKISKCMPRHVYAEKNFIFVMLRMQKIFHAPAQSQPIVITLYVLLNTPDHPSKVINNF